MALEGVKKGGAAKKLDTTRKRKRGKKENPKIVRFHLQPTPPPPAFVRLPERLPIVFLWPCIHHFLLTSFVLTSVTTSQRQAAAMAHSARFIAVLLSGLCLPRSYGATSPYPYRVTLSQRNSTVACANHMTFVEVGKVGRDRDVLTAIPRLQDLGRLQALTSCGPLLWPLAAGSKPTFLLHPFTDS